MEASEIAKLINSPVGFGSHVSVETVQHMLKQGNVASYKANTFVTRRGQAEPRLCVMLSGHVRLTAFTEDGREMLTHIVRPGDCWGVHPCLGDYQETNDSMIEKAGQVLLLKPKAVETLMWTRQDFQKAMVALLCKRLNLAISLAEQFGAWNARERVAWRLLLLSNGLDRRNEDHFIETIALSQETLSSMVHLSRQRTNVILKTLEADGVITQNYGRIVIKDLEALRGEITRAR